MLNLSRLSLPCLAVAYVFGASMPAQAQQPELKIGFLAPRTGILTQLGTDMVNGFQMYLDEKNGVLGGAKVRFIVEDDKGTIDGDVAMAKKLILQDKVDMLVGAVLGVGGLCAGADFEPGQDALYRHHHDGRRPCPAAIRQIPVHSILHVGLVAADACARAMGLRPRLQARFCDRHRLRIRLRAGRRIPEDLRGLRRQGRAENLGAVRHQGLRAVHSEH